MNPWELPVVTSASLRQGVIYATSDALIVGVRPPTEIQRLVMEGIAAAHPWFRDPLRVDVMTSLKLTAISTRYGVTQP